MEEDISLTAQKLLKSINEFRRISKHGSPIEGLTHSEAMLVFCIKKNISSDEAGIKTSELSRVLKVASPTITQQINNLEARGYVERNADKNDRRAVRIKLTEAGEDVLRKTFKAFNEMIEGLVRYLGNERGNELADLLADAVTYFSEIKMNS
ncbi:DNA-binding transcriptional regulator, MarR family [Clostridium acidisoli DSM 12555]|uniref:DNA-binding transcriptional regulator, MarR family n=1 Tax=Clostridium acidisoli DSM 12555 TaxID=1121291 RepID=A0A1W1XUM6_9CLOT|nr:MarR family transcriptional regulator [Clostridium acidisoli]SMC27544.1 DNA-binding transcriptional regulator, MarR family [Clostridium acidisoli DSM 12555]